MSHFNMFFKTITFYLYIVGPWYVKIYYSTVKRCDFNFLISWKNPDFAIQKNMADFAKSGIRNGWLSEIRNKNWFYTILILNINIFWHIMVLQYISKSNSLKKYIKMWHLWPDFVGESCVHDLVSNGRHSEIGI